MNHDQERFNYLHSLFNKNDAIKHIMMLESNVKPTLKDYENYFREAEKLIQFLLDDYRKTKKSIPDNIWCGYEAEQTNICWEKSKRSI